MVAALAISVSPASAAVPAETWSWEAAGIGGGGRFMSPGLSPHDPGLLFSASDMGGVYRSADGGASWHMPPQAALRKLHYQPHHLWTFHPADPQLVFVGAAAGFYRSDDTGRTWTLQTGPWDETGANGAALHRGPRVTTFDPRAPATGAAFFNATPQHRRARVFLSADSGRTWREAAALPAAAGAVINALWLPSAVGPALVVATQTGVWRSDDAGSTWTAASAGLPAPGKDGAPALLDFAGGAGEDDATFLYAVATTDTTATRAGKKDGRRWLWLSTDASRTWRAAPRNGLLAGSRAADASFGLLAASPAYPKIIYASIEGGDPRHRESPGEAPRALYRSDDAGENWRCVWRHDADAPGYNIANSSWLRGQWGWTFAPAGMEVNPRDPDHVFATTITSALVTRDGGNTWRQVHAPDGEKNRQPAGGMMVTSAWRYYFHPVYPERRYVALTDFGGWRSADSGATWRYRPDGNPWHNNTYALAFDPDRPDRVWGASSVTHDIPMWGYQTGFGQDIGGVVVSTDAGENWAPVAGMASGSSAAKGELPRKAVTDIWLDPSSPASARRLWAAVPGFGAYVSEDAGKTWQLRNTGFAFDNLNVLRITGDARGRRLYALTTVRHVGGGRVLPGALYASDDQGRHWQKLFSDPANPFLTQVTPPDAGRPDTLYVSALHMKDVFDEPATGGGAWKSDDAGGTWTRIRDHSTYAVAADPRDPQRLYASSWQDRGDGLHTSRNGGATWTRIGNYPFWRPLTMTFDPRDPHTIYVTNFGAGVWRGTRSEKVSVAPAVVTTATALSSP
ncbi:hypothetical protein OPIT5_10270 [Opitutaceae bacterium TAV5]|nr:hypothetical protein OPIT5_10270 [Opitutaceae bacterium TAV5]